MLKSNIVQSLLLIFLIFLLSCSSVQEEQSREYAQVMQKAREFYNEGKINEAVSVLENVPSDDGEYVEANILLGKLYLKIGDYRDSLKCFKRAVRIDTSNAFAFYYIGYLNQKLNKNNTAYYYYKKAIFIDRNLLDPAYNPLIVQNSFKNKLFIYIYQIEEDHLFSPVTDTYTFYDEKVIANIP